MLKIVHGILLSALIFAASQTAYSQCNEPEPPGTGPSGCDNAPLFCSEAAFDGYCSETGATGVGICPGPFCGSCENYNWFSFIAGSTVIQLQITPVNCQGAGGGSGLQAQIYATDDCTNFTAVSNCESPGTQQVITVTATGLTVGEVYYLMIDGWAGDLCEYSIEVLQGIGNIPPPVIPGGITGVMNVCPGSSIQYSVPTAFGATDYDWTLTPAIGSIQNDGSNQITINFTAPGAAQLCVTPTNACQTGPPVCMLVVSTPIPPSFEFVEFCFGESIQCQGSNITIPGNYTFTYDSWLGCDSVVNCVATATPPIVMPPSTQTVCAPNCVTFAGQQFCNTGGYPVTLTGYEGCDSIVTLILFSLTADAVIQPPGVLGCGGNSTLVLNGSQSTSVPAGSNAVITYSWTGPGTVPPTNQANVTVNAPGTYTLTVTQTLNGVTCTDQASVTVNADTATPDAPTISGEDEPCISSLETYTVTPAATGPSPTGFTWSVVGGTFVDNGNSIDVTWTGAGAGQVCVTADNDCGPSAQTCLTVTIGQAPANPNLSGPASVCDGDVVDFSVNPVDPNADNYTWSVTGGASFTDNGNSISVDFDGANSGQVCVTAANECGSSAQVCIDVTVNTVPAQPTINGDAVLCDGNAGTYSVANDPNATNYVWTTPAGEPITGQGTNAISVDWSGSVGGNVCVTAQNLCGNSPSVCFPVDVNLGPTAQISGSGSFCQGSATNINLTVTLTGTGPWDITYLIDGANPTTVTTSNNPFTLTTNVPGVYTLSDVADANGCPGSVSGSATITQFVLPTASISGSGAICQGSGDCVDLPITLTGTPNWTVVIAINGVNQAPITGISVSPFIYSACQAGDYTVVSVTGGNNCTNPGTGTATVIQNTAPVVSNITTTCNGTNTDYVVQFEISGGDPATYTVNGSSAGISAGPPYIFTSTDIPSGSGYSFVVDDANGCNPATVAQAQVLCSCTTESGTMSQTALTACGTDCITGIYDATNEVFDGDDALQFVLHEGSGLSIVNEIARNSIPEFCFDAGLGMTYGTQYYISAIVGNDLGGGVVDLADPCLAVAQGTPATFFETPTATLAGDQIICVGDTIGLIVTFTGPSPWNLTYDDGSGPQTLTGITSNPYTLDVFPSTTTTYCLTDVNNANCPGTASGCATVTVNTAPVVSNVTTACNPTNTSFTVSFEISGGDPATYSVVPAGTITPGAPAVFTSNPIPTNSTYSFQVSDANSCEILTVSTLIPVVCDCQTQAGTMDLTLVEECGDGPLTFTYDAATQVFDGDDVLEFILHNGSGNTIGFPIIARSATPTFGFDPGTMTYGQTYYVSAIVGNDDGTGVVNDQFDPCLSVAPGTPVIFYEVPSATLSGDAAICLGESTDLIIQFTGDAPWDIVLNDGTNNIPVTGINSTNFTYSVSPATTTTYTLVDVNDENCPALFIGTATVTVNTAPVTTFPTITINGTNTGYVVCFDISGGVAPYTVIDAQGNSVSSTGTFCSVELPCGTGYSFTVDDVNACGPVVVEQANVICDCTSAVGTMQTDTIAVCGTEVATAVYDPTSQALDGDDVVDYILHTGNFVPLQVNTTPSFSYFGGLTYGTVYFISARVGNDDGSGNVNTADPCLVISNGTPVIFNQIPSALLTGNGDICTGECFDLTVTVTGGVAPWTLYYTASGGLTDSIVIPSSPFTWTVCPTVTTIYSATEVADANCTGAASGIGSVTLQGVPFGSNIQEIIDPTNTFMTICFDIIGGDTSTYVVTGWPGTITNSNFFCSDPIPCSQGSYFFLVQDGFQCITDTVQGPIICNCVSGAGVMSPASLAVCEFESVSAAPAVAPLFDGNDVQEYVLHTGNGPALGTIIAINTTPDFTYDPAIMQCDITYYISSVVGDDDGTGAVDLTDDCLSVSVGTPVVFECLPTATFTGNAVLCEGDSAAITFDLNGEGPYNVVVSDGITQINLDDVSDGFVWNVTPALTTTYTLVSVFDITTQCDNTASGSVTVTVNPIVNAGTANPSQEFCQGETNIINLGDEIQGEDAGGLWSETSSIPSTGGAFNAGAGTFNIGNQAPGTYTFRYTVDGLPPCPDDFETVTVVVNPNPVADAGNQQEITCDQTVATIGGPGTSTGPNFSYEWINTTTLDVVGSTATIDLTLPGTYSLTVTNTLTGCTATDQVTVIESVEVPIPEISVSDVSCFGERDGFIIIENITGGVPPYLCSLDGGPFTGQKVFGNLGAGTYTIAIQDSKGCETVVTIDITQPDELVVELVANFQSEDESIQLGDELELSIQVNVPFDQLDTIIWTPADLITCDSCATNIVAPDITTTFSVTVADGPCFDSDDLRVIVKKDRPVYIPNVFSPNGDGDNDIFFIQAGQSVAQIRSFLVFNRWGETVFQAFNFQPNDQTIGWDGRHRGNLVNPAVYAYFVEVEYIDGYVEILEGDVTVIR